MLVGGFHLQLQHYYLKRYLWKQWMQPPFGRRSAGNGGKGRTDTRYRRAWAWLRSLAAGVGKPSAMAITGHLLPVLWRRSRQYSSGCP